VFMIEKYTSSQNNLWDAFVLNAKNSHFMFRRAYMDYHADRFEDHSLMIYNEKGKLIALLPANLKESVLYSHQGLTFGGLLIDASIRTEMVLDIFKAIRSYATEQGLSKLVYKCMPYIYHTMPAEEDSYALFVNDAYLIRRDVSATIFLGQAVRYSKGRKWTVNKAKKENLQLEEERDLTDFWRLLEDTILQQHGNKPVHSLQEIMRLKESFPKNIRLFIAKKDDVLLSGALIYENKDIVHTQYLANSEKGRELGALDVLLDYLIKEVYKDKKYFDFGISNEDQGRTLNTGLMAQKEGFGARAVAHDFYELKFQ